MAPSGGGRVVGKSDVMISYHPSDSDLVDRIILYLTERNFTVWQNNAGVNNNNNQNNARNDERKRGKAVLDTKVFLMIVSQASLTHAPCKDEAALAYISGKPLIPCGVESYQSLEPFLDGAMRMLLAKLNWTFFINANELDKRLSELSDSVAESIGPQDVFLDDLCPSNVGDVALTDEKEFQVTEAGSGVFVGLIREHSVQHHDLINGGFQYCLDFWDLHFMDRDSIAVDQLVDVFVEEYGERLAYHISDLLRQREARKQQFSASKGADQEPIECIVDDWVRQLLKNDLFHGKESVERITYEKICSSARQNNRLCSPQQPQSQNNDNFYRRVKAYAIGKLAMTKVFNMNSSVRLVAIQNLGQYQTPEIVAGLTELLNDVDPNIRTVATLALGRCVSAVDSFADIVHCLVKMIKDPDRLVRQAACISLGHMRAGDAVKTLVHVWRNEPISDVRNAAHAALERMEGEAARIAIEMTRKLEKEVKSLSAPDSVAR